MVKYYSKFMIMEVSKSYSNKKDFALLKRIFYGPNYLVFNKNISTLTSLNK